jgi:ribonuclease BN (tRNA processing enzyme)
MASVTFLGTGPGDVMAGRFQSAVLLEGSGTNVLLDAGEPCSGRLLQLGFALEDLDAVLVTHAHSDHTGGLALLLQASGLHGRDRALPLGLPAHLTDPFRKWLDAVLLPEGRLGFPLEVFGWKAGRVEKFGELAVTPRLTTHVRSGEGSSAGPRPESFLFDITLPAGRMVYSGDLGSADDLDTILDEPIDLLICELAHLTPGEVVAKLQLAKIGTLCLTHVAAGLDARRSEIKRLCEDGLAGTAAVHLPDDGARIEF